MSSFPEIELIDCVAAAYLELQQLIEDEATQCDDTLDLTTAFLIVKDIKNKPPHPTLEPAALARDFLHSLSEPYSRYLSKQHSSHSWYQLGDREAQTRISELLTQGTSLEIPVFGDLEVGTKYTQRLIQLVGESYTCLSNVKQESYQQKSEPYFRKEAGFCVFKVGHCRDAGVVLISRQRIAMLWFLGYH